MPTAGNDTITGTPGNETINGLAGDDSINGAGGNDVLSGNVGNDTLEGGAGADTLFGDSGDDSLRGGNGNDSLTAGFGNDILNGDEGDDTIWTGDGSLLQASGGAGADRFIINFVSPFSTATTNINDFNFNEDSLLFTGTFFSVTSNLSLDGVGANNDVRFVFGGHTINLLNPVMPATRFGTAGDDNLFGTIVADTLDGLGGNDLLNGGGGADLLIGGDGDDQLFDQEGFFDQRANDTLRGGAGNDRLFDGDGNDLLEGGDGDDAITLANGDDRVRAGAGRDTITTGVSGNDTIEDYDPSSDVLDIWNAGLRGFTGLDLDGDGAFDDALISYIAGSTSNLTLLNFNNPSWRGTSSADTRLGLPFNELIFGDAGADSLYGRGGDDSLFGEAGNDFLDGGEGDDIVDGGAGNDWLVGGDRDTLLGGEGDDTINSGPAGPIRATGGAGNDLFVINVNFPQTIGDHVITDFSFAEDRFDFDEAGSIQFGLDLDGDQQSDDAKVIYNNELINLLNVAAPGRVFRTGTAAGERLFGSIVDDAIEAGAGSDTVSGGSGNDLLSGQDGADSIWGGTGFDTIFGGVGDDTLSGGDGNDVINDGAGNDLIQEFIGNDTIFLGEGADTIQAGNGIWRLTIHGFNTGEDRLTGGPPVLLSMGLQDIDADGAADDLRMVYSGGATIDLLSVQFSTVFLAPSFAPYIGNAFNDTIVGSQSRDRIDGMSGDDVIFAGGDIDTLYGGDGSDTVFGQSGNDWVFGGNGNDYVSGGDGNDLIGNEPGNDTLTGDDGDDVFGSTPFSNAPLATDVDLILAGAGNDTVDATVAWEYVDAGAGNDLVRASTQVSAYGLDALHGGTGIDTLSLESYGSGVLTMNLATGVIQDPTGASGTFSGFERIQLGASRDIVVGWTGNPTIDLGSGDDWFADYSPTGAASNDTVFGGFGNDALYGLAGDDSLNGGESNDFVIGGDGADTLIGGAGGDWMHGGAGADTFRYLAVSDAPLTGALDVAAGFEIGVDKIDLAAIDANSASFGDDAFTIGALQAGVAGRLAITLAADLGGGERLWQVRGDVNGDGVADFQIWVVGTGGALGAGDFVL